MAYGSAPARQPAGDQSKLATLARLLNPSGSAFHSSYTGDVANDLPGGKPMGASPTRQQLALILAGGTTRPTRAQGPQRIGLGRRHRHRDAHPARSDPCPTARRQRARRDRNAGGASQPGNAGAAGDPAGIRARPPSGAPRRPTSLQGLDRGQCGEPGQRPRRLVERLVSPIDENGLIDLGGGAGLLSGAAMLAPGYAGIGPLPRADGRSRLQRRRDQRRPPTARAPRPRCGQIAGGVTGANGYGNLGGNTTVANPEQFTPRINSRIGELYDNNPNFFGKPNLYDPNSLAETSNGQDYEEGPGGILGWLGRQVGLLDGPKHAFSIRNTNAFLGGPGSMGSTATGAAGERGIAGGGSIVPPGGGTNALPAIGTAALAGPAIVSGQDNPPAAATGRHALLAMGFTESQIADGSAARAALGGPFGSPGSGNAGLGGGGNSRNTCPA